VTAPDGIRKLLTGGGDCRRLPFADEPWLWEMCEEACPRPFTIWTLAAVLAAALAAASLLGLLIEGDRRCLLRYDVDRGRAGRWTGAGSGVMSLYEWLRLRIGLFGLEFAGDRWVGGV